MGYAEKRTDMRMSVECGIQYRAVNSTSFYPAKCTSLSGSGVSFVAQHAFDVGKAIEIHITPQNLVNMALTAFVEVTRVEPSISAKEYEISAIIKTIKG
jgi:dihydroorotase